MTCYWNAISKQAPNCIPNPPWGEGCEICVPINFTPIIILGIILIILIIFIIIYWIKQKQPKKRKGVFG